MAAIDSRATITCNLGEVITGGVSDSYIQGSGLVFTRGQLTLEGVSTPPIGSEVTINYAMNSGSRGQIPRSLVVLSAFADPFRQTTEVSVGCLLTYLSDVQPVPNLEDGRAAYLNPRQLECLNGLPKSAFVPPIFADDVYRYCTDKLGIGTGGVTLDGAYMMDEYDLSQGYVSAINNLLLSEGYVGFMDGTRFNVIKLANRPLGIRSLSDRNIIDVSGVNNGELPASIVIVPYVDKKLERYEPDDAQWEEVTTVGDLESVTLKYNSGTTTVTHRPTTTTRTEYGPPIDLTDQCELLDGGYGNLSDTVVKTTTRRSTVMGFAAGGYVTALLDAGKSVNPSLGGDVVEVTSYEFDEKDRPKRTITEIYEPFFVYAGRMSLEWVFDDSHVVFGNESLLVERTVEEFTYAGELSIPEGFKPGQDVSEPVVYQRTSRYTYQAWGKTQGGSQGPAESTTLEAFTSASEVISFVFGSLGLVLTDSEVTANKVFGPKGQQRPGEVDRAVEQGTLDGQGREIKYVEIQFSNDGDQSRVVQYSPPHLTEDYFTSTGAVVSVNAPAVSMNFGRVQHRLAVGNRLGMNITSTPENLAVPPYTGLRVSAAGYSGEYATNGLNFSFGRDGIVASVDALYVGANGIDSVRTKAKNLGAPWFYLPAGYDPTNLPATGEGQLIPPFSERINTDAGIALGVRVTSQQAEVLVPKTIGIGVALGVDGTNGNYKQQAHVGVAVGIEVNSSLALENTVAVGVRLGVDVVPVQSSAPVGVGVALGVNIGPVPNVTALLMHFDDPGADGSAEETWTDSSPNGITMTNTNVGSYSSAVYESDAEYTSRFGAGYAYFSSGAGYYDDTQRGGVISSRTTALQLSDEWTIEFWLRLNSVDLPETKPAFDWVLLGMDSAAWGYSIQFKVAFDSNVTPSLAGQVWRADNDFAAQPLSGSTIPLDTWIHCAICKTPNGAALFQDGTRTALFSWENLAVRDVDRLGIGGEMDNLGQFTSRYGVFDMDELRVLSNKAVYDLSADNYLVPTGPFSS